MALIRVNQFNLRHPRSIFQLVKIKCTVENSSLGFSGDIFFIEGGFL
jgi:hypothetical protein